MSIEIRTICTRLEELRSAGESCALATIVSVQALHIAVPVRKYSLVKMGASWICQCRMLRSGLV